MHKQVLELSRELADWERLEKQVRGRVTKEEREPIVTALQRTRDALNEALSDYAKAQKEQKDLPKVLAEAPFLEPVIISPAALAALVYSGNKIEVTDRVVCLPSPHPDPALPPSVQRVETPMLRIEIVKPPRELTLVHVCNELDVHLALRTKNDPPFPGERLAPAWWEQGMLTPCPRCGAALVWNEAGYVPGYRICLQGHHCQLSGDGLTAKCVDEHH